MEPRHLLTYEAAQRLSGVARRTFFKRLKEHNIVAYIDPADRRKHWIDRRDVEKIARPVEQSERGSDTAA